MSDGVIFIFKTLIKVPVIIFASFFVFNIFAFIFIYFKMLGFSYVAMQEVVENNYISQMQANQLNNYLTNMQNEIPMAQNITLIVGTDASGRPVLWDKGGAGSALTNIQTGAGADYGTAVQGSNAGARIQYGATKTVGVHCEYEFVWPLSYQATLGGQNVDGYTGNINGTLHDDTTAYDPATDPYNNGNINSTDSQTHMNRVRIPIDIYYTVPGLKYYPDL